MFSFFSLPECDEELRDPWQDSARALLFQGGESTSHSVKVRKSGGKSVLLHEPLGPLHPQVLETIPRPKKQTFCLVKKNRGVLPCGNMLTPFLKMKRLGKPWQKSEESQVYKWELRIDQPHHPLGAEAVLGHQHEAGQQGGVHNQVDLLPRKEDQRCPASSWTVWKEVSVPRHPSPTNFF